MGFVVEEHDGVLSYHWNGGPLDELDMGIDDPRGGGIGGEPLWILECLDDRPCIESGIEHGEVPEGVVEVQGPERIPGGVGLYVWGDAWQDWCTDPYLFAEGRFILPED